MYAKETLYLHELLKQLKVYSCERLEVVIVPFVYVEASHAQHYTQQAICAILNAVSTLPYVMQPKHGDITLPLV